MNDLSGTDIIYVIVMLFAVFAFLFWGLQKLMENLSYGWYAGRYQAEREHLEKVARAEPRSDFGAGSNEAA